MTEYPIIFNSDMVKAILEGRKTQTRRPINPQPDEGTLVGFSFFSGNDAIEIRDYTKGTSMIIKCPFGKVGNRLWVKETWNITQFDNHGKLEFPNIYYRADSSTQLFVSDVVWKYNRPNNGKWRPSIHMPRWASRITLKITGVNVQRIQEITHKECELEGANDEKWQSWSEDAWNAGLPPGSHIENIKEHFENIWNSIYGNWDSNPWVWVINFEKI